MPDYILFDLDGTLTDSKPGVTKSIQYSLSKFGIEVADLDELTKFIGPSFRESLMVWYGFSEKDLKLAIKYYHEHFKEKGMFDNSPYSNIDKTLTALKEKGKKLAVATLKPTVFADQILDHFDLSHYFEHIIGSDLNGQFFGKKEIIGECIKRFNEPNKEKYIMVGDTKYDILGAKEAGISSVGVLYGYGLKEDLINAGADCLVSSHEDILEL
ncbi:HAD hydrolase-like protein [Candidatus Parcubacteria bacterium]|nr:HAD hydrolase-like protein [Candidatus Parcubacteria bacterium]